MKYPIPHPTGPVLMGEEKYVAPHGYSDHYHHPKNWIEASAPARLCHALLLILNNLSGYPCT
ncbi:MAG TPA: hypothetical protein VMO17_05810, partial [Terriglobia bacterium]|nr:hypothetical protein [Terriglobia bacterium]